MTLSAADLTALKKYMRIDGDADDDIVKLSANAAQSYLVEAGVPEPVPGTDKTLCGEFPLYFLALCSLALNWYDNRDAVSDGSVVIAPLGTTAIIKTLQVSNLDTSGVPI